MYLTHIIERKLYFIQPFEIFTNIYKSSTEEMVEN